jgi:site-specific recombinase XerD
MNTLAETTNAYLQNCARVRRLSPNTIAAYRADLQKFLFGMGSSEFSAESVRRCLLRMASDPDLAPKTVRRRIASVRAFLRAVAAPLARDAFEGQKIVVKVPAALPRSISRGDLERLLSARTTYGDPCPMRLGVLLLAATGLRVSELCSLTLSRIYIDGGEIIVPGKGARERVVMIANRDIRAALREYVMLLPDRSDPAAALLRNKRGRPLTSQCFRWQLHRLASKAGLNQRVTPHMLRHTAATLLLEKGVDTRFVQRLLGHASIATTQIYTRVTDTSLRRALECADTIAEFL